MKEREVIKQMLENICAAKLCEFNSMSSRDEMIRLMDQAITAAKEALAQPEQEPDEEQKPDGVVMGFTEDGKAIVDHDGLEEGWVLYTSPYACKPLTDAQRKDITAMWSRENRNYTVADIIDAVEAAHGIKEQQ